jgi:ABC-2 type transport system ATP-binding protein
VSGTVKAQEGGQTVIEVNEVRKRYGSQLAVDDLSFRVHPGQVTGFLGPNGAGKTTTMRLILGLATPTSGQTLVNREPYRRLRRPVFAVGALLDANAVHPGRSAFHHLLWIAQSNGIGRSRVKDVLDVVGLTDVAHRRVGGFSPGMRQRLGIAAALLGDPPIVMFDEPINGLDPDGIRWIRTLLKSLAAQGRTVFVSSHLLSEMAHVADHLVVIGRGQLIVDTSLAEFVRRGTRGQVMVRSPRGAELAQLLTRFGASVTAEADGALIASAIDADTVGELAAAHGIPLRELSTRGVSLEEVFMQVTSAATEYRADMQVQQGKETR